MLISAAQWLSYRYAGEASGANLAASIVIGAVLDAIVIAQTKADVDGETNPWPLALERLWAVVIANFIFSLITAFALQLLVLPDFGARIFGAALLPLAAALVFAECIAITVPDDRWWWLVPAAVGGSLRTSWQSGANMSRAILIFAIQLVPLAAGNALDPVLKAQHVALSSFWGEVPLGILVTIPLDVLIVLAFFDMSGYRQKSAADE